jgi:hypothetical protein
MENPVKKELENLPRETPIELVKIYSRYWYTSRTRSRGRLAPVGIQAGGVR